ncbi:MAG: hydroxyacylglutathione hydrolase [Rhodobacteraceae bacterium]|nr:hydroxyacylglutathione hydrolase [Paracoccaceae bacterium]
MSLERVTIPCLADNYAFLLKNTETGAVAVIDAPESAPILAALAERDWTLTDILLTHHHGDHIDGVPDLRTAFPEARVIGAAADAYRLPPLDLAVTPGDTVSILDEDVQIIDVSGHTIGHIAFYFAQDGSDQAGMAFTGDSLMALGCGRLFEGSPQMMWESLSRLMALPDETLICSGHEYTQSNARFAVTIDPDNSKLISRCEAVGAARAAGEATVPSILGNERATNPFLRASDPTIRAALGLAHATDAEVFAQIRRRKDQF